MGNRSQVKQCGEKFSVQRGPRRRGRVFESPGFERPKPALPVVEAFRWLDPGTRRLVPVCGGDSGGTEPVVPENPNEADQTSQTSSSSPQEKFPQTPPSGRVTRQRMPR
jgi:hypothetical protein